VTLDIATEQTTHKQRAPSKRREKYEGILVHMKEEGVLETSFGWP
jgi:hypothetical protein